MAITEALLADIKEGEYKAKILISGRSEPLILPSIRAADCKALLNAWSQAVTSGKPKVMMHRVHGVGYESIDVSRIDYIAFSDID